MANENETVEQVCELMDKESGEYHIDDYGLSYNDIWNYRERILSAHKRELAAKDAEIARLKSKNFDLNGCLLAEQELAKKRNALIKELADALKIASPMVNRDSCSDCAIWEECNKRAFPRPCLAQVRFNTLVAKAREVTK